MPDYTAAVDRLKDPANIKEANCASSPYLLRRVFAGDATVRGLVKAGPAVVEPIARTVAREGRRLPEISLAAYTYILEQVDRKAVVRIMKPLYEARMARPGPFFVQLAAHAFRESLGLSVRPLLVSYDQAELAETLARLP